MIKILIMDDSRPKTEAIKRYLTDWIRVRY